MKQINAGLEEFVEHSYYEKWEGHRFKKDMEGTPEHLVALVDELPYPKVKEDFQETVKKY